VKYVPILDVAVGATRYSNDPALVFGKELDIFCYSPLTGKYFKGNVWPGNAYFPDMFHPKTELFWSVMLEKLH
jgi:alpha-glucosidase